MTFTYVCSCFHLTNFESVLCTLTSVPSALDSLLAFLLSTLVCVFLYYYYYSMISFLILGVDITLSEIIPLYHLVH